MPHRLRHGLLGWRDLYPSSLAHGLDPGLLLLRALGTEEVGADSSVLGLWGEAVRGTGPSLVYPVNSHLQGKDTNTHRKGSPSVRLLTAPSFSPEELKSQARRVACSSLRYSLD